MRGDEAAAIPAWRVPREVPVISGTPFNLDGVPGLRAVIAIAAGEPVAVKSVVGEAGGNR